jgi:hypothetical protein
MRFLNEPTEETWIQRFANAFSDPEKAFNFPIKYPALTIDKPTKDSLYITAGILAGGMIVTALILANKKR